MVIMADLSSVPGKILYNGSHKGRLKSFGFNNQFIDTIISIKIHENPGFPCSDEHNFKLAQIDVLKHISGSTGDARLIYNKENGRYEDLTIAPIKLKDIDEDKI